MVINDYCYECHVPATNRNGDFHRLPFQFPGLPGKHESGEWSVHHKSDSVPRNHPANCKKTSYLIYPFRCLIRFCRVL